MTRPLLLRIAGGSITQMKAAAIVVSHFQGVAVSPGGAEGEVDEALGGSITLFATTRSLAGALGDFFAIPALASGIHAPVVVVMGLGPSDIFTRKIKLGGMEESGLLRQVAYRLIEGLLQLDITTFATVLIGASAGLDPAEAAFYLIEALCDAICRLDADRRINEFSIVEADRAKIPAIKTGYARAQEKFKDRLQFEMREVTLPDARHEAAAPRPLMYLSARKTGDRLFYSVLTDRPCVPMSEGLFSSATIGGLIAQLRGYGERQANGDATAVEAEIKRTGSTLYELLLPREVRQCVREFHQAFDLILSIERSLVQVPWELLYDEELGCFLGELAMGRQIIGVESFRQRRMGSPAGDGEINMLIIANPSGDLAAAQKEGEALKAFIDANMGQVKADLWDRAAIPSGSRKSIDILKRLYAGNYEVVHYSGHAFYDRIEPQKSGWLVDVSQQDWIRAFELSNLPKPPIMVFANACESAVSAGEAPQGEMPYGLAEAFLLAGVDIYVGTAWRIPDEPAATLAQTFYHRLLTGKGTLGAALSHARRALIDRYTYSEPAWASYMLYGTPTFQFLG